MAPRLHRDEDDGPRPGRSERPDARIERTCPEAAAHNRSTSLVPAAVLLLLAFPPQARLELPLQIAAEDGAATWSRPDGTGFANDVVREAFRAAGVDVTLLVVPYARCKQMVIEGTVAACFSMSRDPGQRTTVLFPATPLFVCNSELIQDPARPLPASRLQDLPRGTVIGTVLSYEYPAAVERARRAGNIVLEESPSETILLRKLADGRVPAVIVNVNGIKPLDYLIARARITSGIERAGRVGVLESYIGFSARHPRAAWARERYEEGMRRIAANGVLARLTRQWSDTALAVTRAWRAEPPGRRR